MLRNNFGNRKFANKCITPTVSADLLLLVGDHFLSFLPVPSVKMVGNLWSRLHVLPNCYLLSPGLEIDNEKVENNSIFDTSKKSSKFLHSITKIKSREYQSIDNVKSILFSD